MQKEHHLHVEKAIIHYVKDFANVEEVLAEMTKEARDYRTKNKPRLENYLQNFRDTYQNVAMFLDDKSFLEISVVKGLSQQEQDHWPIKDQYKGKRSKDKETKKIIKAHQLKTTRLRDKVGRIIKKLATRIFPTVSQLLDQADKDNGPDDDYNSNVEDEDDGNVEDEGDTHVDVEEAMSVSDNTSVSELMDKSTMKRKYEEIIEVNRKYKEDIEKMDDQIKKHEEQTNQRTRKFDQFRQRKEDEIKKCKESINEKDKFLEDYIKRLEISDLELREKDKLINEYISHFGEFAEI